MVAGEEEKTQSSERERVLGGRVKGEEEKASRLIIKMPLPFCSFYFKPFNNKHR